MPQSRDRSLTLALLAALVVFLPSLTLVPLGGLWLWQSGWLLYWALGACLLVLAGYVGLSRLLVPLDAGHGADEEEGGTAPESEDPKAATAWRAVGQIADAVDPAKLDSREAVLDLAALTVRRVAAEMHPDRADPLLRFTVPDALLIVERVSARMRGYIVATVPFGHRIPVEHLASIYSWRGALGAVEKAYDVWRLLRLANPVTAATSEARERLSGQLIRIARDRLAKRIAKHFVIEVGRAAIELYGGRIAGDA